MGIAIQRCLTVLLPVLILGAAPWPAAAQAPASDPNRNLQLMLIRNALTAVNHANLTGNYTVLRDLGTPAFRERNSAAQLASIFQRIRDQKTDLSPTLLHEPQFTQPPALNELRQLVLVGCFPTRPLQVQFQLAFQQVNGAWMIDAISVGFVQTQPAPVMVWKPAPAQQPILVPLRQGSAN